MEVNADICRYCNGLFAVQSQPVVTLAYWNQNRFVCHAVCKKEGERQEALNCQTIDADCNDCRHFRRGEIVYAWLSDMQNKKKITRFVNMGCITGFCIKFRKLTMAYPHMWTGRPCFEHRRIEHAPTSPDTN
jgi:hypothetical protein